MSLRATATRLIHWFDDYTLAVYDVPPHLWPRLPRTAPGAETTPTRR